MSFLSPWYLLGLMGMAIPLAIHLIRRQKAERVVLPTVRFLKRAPKRLVHFQKLQQWLLLALRVAMAGLLAVAFARPILSGPIPQLVGGTPQSLVIVLDTSMSMRYGNRFQEAKAKAIDLVRSLKPGDEAAVIPFADRPGPMAPLTTDAVALEAFVKALSPPGYHATRFLPALRAADQLLRSASNPEKTICMISDHQRSAASGDPNPWILSPGIGFQSIRVGDDDGFNLAVTDVVVAAYTGEGGSTHRVTGRIRNFGSAQASNVRVRLEIDGRPAASEALDLDPGSERILTFPVTETRSGQHSGVVGLQGDGFEPDNRRFFTFRVAPPLRVLLLFDGFYSKEGGDDPTVWLRAALEGHPGALFHVDVGDVRYFRTNTLASYAAVVLMNVGPLGQESTRALTAYIKGGGGLLLAPADKVDGDGFNRAWAEVTPAFLNRRAIMTDGAAVAITRVQKRHAIVRSLQKEETADFGAARFEGYWVTDPAPRSEVVLGFENGHPALLEKTAGNGRVLLFTSSLDPVWNNFPRQVMYLPMMHEALNYLAGRREQQEAFEVGDIAPLMVPEGGAARIISPVGRETLLPSTRTGTAFFDATNEPGLYEARTGSRTGRFSVNVSARESDLGSMSVQKIQDRIILSETEPAPPAAARASTAQIERDAAQKYWWWLLMLVLGMGFLETYLANRTYR